MKNFTLGMPDDLHDMLIAAVDRSGKSLNALICDVLARNVEEQDLRRSLVETVRAEMRAEFEGRKPGVVDARSAAERSRDYDATDAVDGAPV